MQPAVPEDPGPYGRRPPGPPGEDVFLSADDVGAFSQGTALSRWALARYLVGRAIGASVADTLLVVAGVVFAVAAACQWVLHVTWLAVIVAIFGVGVLLVRWLVEALLRRFTEARRYRPVQRKLQQLVGDTRKDVLRELRRVGLPSHLLTLPLLAFRLVGGRRHETVDRLRRFDAGRVVPPGRLDELHMLLRGGAGPDGGPRR